MPFTLVIFQNPVDRSPNQSDGICNSYRTGCLGNYGRQSLIVCFIMYNYYCNDCVMYRLFTCVVHVLCLHYTCYVLCLHYTCVVHVMLCMCYVSCVVLCYVSFYTCVIHVLYRCYASHDVLCKCIYACVLHVLSTTMLYLHLVSTRKKKSCKHSTNILQLTWYRTSF